MFFLLGNFFYFIGQVLLGDVVRVLRALNEDIDDVIEVSSNYQMRKVEYPKKELQLSDEESRISQKAPTIR